MRSVALELGPQPFETVVPARGARGFGFVCRLPLTFGVLVAFCTRCINGSRSLLAICRGA